MALGVRQRRESALQGVISGRPRWGVGHALELRGWGGEGRSKMGWAALRALVYLLLEQPRRHGGSEASLTSVLFLTAPFVNDFLNYYVW